MLQDENRTRAFILDLFASLEERSIVYCVLHSYETLPSSIGSDLDLAVDAEPAEFEKVLRAVAARNRWDVMQRLWYDVPFCFYYVLKARDKESEWIAVDTLVDRRGICRYGFSSRYLTSGRRRSGSWYRPDPAVELCYRLVKGARKRNLHDKDPRPWRELLREAGRARAVDELTRHFGRWGARAGWDALARGEGRCRRLLTLALCVLHVIRRRYGRPTVLGRRLFWRVRRVVWRVAKPRGLVLWLDRPPDSALRASIEARLGPAFRRIYVANSLIARLGGVARSSLVLAVSRNGEKCIQTGYRLPRDGERAQPADSFLVGGDRDYAAAVLRVLKARAEHEMPVRYE